MVYEDLQAFGTFSPGDIGIQGVKIELLLNGTVVAETITKNDGSYSFTGLAGGLYTVQEESPLAGFFDVTDTDGDTNGKSTISVALPPGGSSGENNFLEVRVSTVSGMVTEDTNNDDKGEDPIAGVPVTLCKKDIPTDCVTTTTDNTGGFSFGGIVPGTYCVVETNIGNYIDVGDSIGSNGDELEGGSVDDPNKVCFVVVAGIDTTDIVFVDELPSAEPSGAPSSAPTTSGTISGFVLEDIDDLGEFSATDTPLAGVQINLVLGTTIKTTTTDGSGAYSFTGLAAGDYIIIEKSPLPGFVDVKDTDGDANGPNTIAVTLLAGGSSEDNNFLEVGFSLVAGIVLEDIDSDDAGEDPIVGVPVSLCKKDAPSNCTTTSTGSTGSFSFGSVEPGEYCVVQSNIGDYIDVSDSIGTNGDELEGGSVDDPNKVCFVVVAGIDTTDIVFVDELPSAEPSGAPSSAPTTSGTISGSVLLDDDEDGNFSSGDSPIAGVKITLMKGGTTVRTTATDGTGVYFFSGLTGGDYTVLEDTVLDTTDIKDADGNANGPNTIAVALPAGGLSEKNDFLEAPPVALLKIGGFVGYHTALITDGSFVGPIPSVLITLKKDGAVLKTTLTDANGNFLFSDVQPGAGYSVLEQNPTTPVRYFDLYDSDMGGTANLSNIGPFMLTEDTLTLKFVDWKPGAARRLSEPKNLRSQE